MKYTCHICQRVAADIRDASIAKGTVLVCATCIKRINPPAAKSSDIPDFLRGLMKGGPYG